MIMFKVLTRKNLLRLVPLKPFICTSEVIFPYYHVVNDDPLPHIRHLYAYRNILEFRRDLDTLLRYFCPIGLDDVINAVSGRQTIKQPSFHLTFDDGFRECHDIIAPILKEKGIPATFFVCTDFLNNADMYHRNKMSVLLDKTGGHLDAEGENAVKQVFNNNGISYTGFHDTLKKLTSINGHIIDDVALALGVDIRYYLKKEQPYLTSNQIRSLLSDGFTIGSHSKNHSLFSNLTLAEQTKQVKVSMVALRNNFASSSRAFAFPHNDSGVSISFYQETSPYADIYFGTGKMLKDCIPNSIQRFSMEDENLNCEEILKQNYLLKAFNRLSGRDRLNRKP